MGKIAIYIISAMVSLFAVSGINFDKIIKSNHIWEARILVIIISIALGYFVANFIIEFLQYSQIIEY